MRLMILMLALLTGPAQAATSPFNGTWLTDIASIKQPPDIAMLTFERGIFGRGREKLDFAVRADGHVHAVPADEYVDAVAVRLLSPRHLRETDLLKGKVVYVITFSVSADGRAMTEQVTDYSKPDAKPIATIVKRKRIARPTPGASWLSGRWLSTEVATTRSHLTDHLRLVGNRFSRSGPGGSGFDAVIGGPPVPVRGDAPSTRTAVTMPNAHNIIERLYADKKLAMTITMTLQPDGKSIKTVAKRQSDGSVFAWTLRRQ